MYPPLKETKLYSEAGMNCQRTEFSLWHHPIKDVLKKREWVKLDWVDLCKKNNYPVLGVHFKYDPQGKTKDYFIPLYLEMLKANGYHPLSIVVLSDNTIINLSSMANNGISKQFEYFSE